MSRKLRKAAQLFRSNDKGDINTCISVVLSLASDAADTRTLDEIYLLVAIAAHRAGLPRTVLNNLRMLSAEGQSQMHVHRLFTAALLAMSRFDEAEPHLLELVKRGAADAVAVLRAIYVRRGLEALAKGEPQAAINAFSYANVSKVEDPTTAHAGWIGYLRAMFEVGGAARIQHVFALCPQWHNDRAANLLAARAALDPLDADAVERHLRNAGLDNAGPDDEVRGLWWTLCRTLFAARRFDEVVRRFAAAAQGSAVDDAGRAVVIAVGFSYYALRDVARSTAIFDSLVNRCPSNPLVRYHAAYHATMTGDRKRAIAHLRHLREARELSTLLWWSANLHEGAFEAIRRAVTPEFVAAFPPGPFRELLRMIGGFASSIRGEPTRTTALLNSADENRLPVQGRRAMQQLKGHAALAGGAYGLAVSLLRDGSLKALANIEYARSLADRGSGDKALEVLHRITSTSEIAAALSHTRREIRVRLALQAVREGRDATRLLADLRREQPDLAGTVSLMEEFAHLRSTILIIQTSRSLSELSERAAMFRRLAQDDAGSAGQGQCTRRRDLNYLAAVAFVRAAACGGDVPQLLGCAATVLEASLAAAPDFGPSAALLGVVLLYRGDARRALALVDIAQRQGISSGSIQSALAVAYIREQRLVDAKRLCFEQLSSGRSGLRRELARLIGLEATNPLRPSTGAAPPVEEPPEPEPFADVEVMARLPVLVHHLESCARRADAATSSKLRSTAHQLKQLATVGDPAKVSEVERDAIKLIAGRIS